MLANDSHYKYLLIFLIPVTLYFVIINWWGLKSKHTPPPSISSVLSLILCNLVFRSQ